MAEIKDEISTPEDAATKMYGGVMVEESAPFGASSFAEVIEAERANEAARTVRKRAMQVPDLVEGIFSNPMIEDKMQAIANLGPEFSNVVTEEMSRKERWQPLTDKAVNIISDLTKQEKPMKTEGGVKYPASDFAYVPDPDKPSTWKLRLSEGKSGNITRSQLGAAAAAFSPGGFRGQKVQIPGADMAKVKAKIRAAYKKLGVDAKDMPESIRKERNNFMLYKEVGGRYRWVAIYSNKFRDRDNPPEIIAEESHINFVKQVNSGNLPYPELWLWHIKESKWGQADFVGWDDNGFAVATGMVDKGKEWIAESLLDSGLDLLTSHGMPRDSIKRVETDPTVIVGHITKEISPLLADSAANEHTGFILNNEVNKMALSPEDREKLKRLNVDADRLEAETESKSKETEGLEFKEVEKPDQDQAQAYVSRDEMSELVKSLATSTNQMAEVVGSLVARIEAIEANKLTVDKDTVERTPAASLTDLYKSVIGAEETKVDGRTALAKSGPEETATPTGQHFKTLSDVIIQRNREIERGEVQ
jgi:hypothetical protein